MCHLKRDGKKYQPGNVFTCTKSSDSSHRFYCGWEKDWESSRTWDPCGKCCNRKLTSGIQRHCQIKCLLGCTQREANVEPQAGQSKNELFKKLTTTREADEKYPTKEDIGWKRSLLLEPWYVRSCPKLRWEILRISKERCVFSSAGGNTMHRLSPNTSKRLWNIGELSAVCAQVVLKPLYLAKIGRPDLLLTVNILARSETKWNKACAKRLPKLINNINQIQKKTTGNSVMWEIKAKFANLVNSKVLHLQVTCAIQNQRQDDYCAYWDHTRLLPSRGCARRKPQFLTAMQSLKLCRSTQVYVWMVYQLSNLESVCWNHFPVTSAKGNMLSVINARESFTF